MDRTEKKERMQFVKGQQRIHAGQVQVCPRCGKAALRQVLDSNPESMSFKGVRICARCADSEQTMHMLYKEDDTGAWAAMTDMHFKVLPEDGMPIAISAMPCGTVCWGWAYAWENCASLPRTSIKPVKGVLCEATDRAGDRGAVPEWFVPFQKGSRKLARTKAVRAEAVNLHSGQSEAEEAYDRAVYETYKKFEGLAAMVRSDMLDPDRFQP